MIIKCPHCRFKYEEEVAPGIQEFSCVCPRCAYPFTIKLSEADKDGAGETDNAELNIARERSNSVETVPDASPQNNPARPSTQVYPPRQPAPMPPFTQATNSAEHRQTGCCLKTLILLIIAVTGIVLLVRSCYRSFTIEEIGTSEDGYSVVTEDSKDDEYASDSSPRKLPKWVQGNWVYLDENNFSISVSIHGRNIAETSGGETSSGTIIYENGIITAHFNDGHEMRYKVYKDEHVIDAGSSNLKMKKIE